MQMNQATDAAAFTSSTADASFSSVWGNAMQREDFLALAAGLRQYNVFASDMAFSGASPAEQVETSTR